MSGIVGSRLNNRGSGLVGSLGTDGQVLTSSGAGVGAVYEAAAGGTALTGSTNNTIPTVTGADAISGETNLTFDGTDLTVATGNVVMGTSGKGIDFSATSDGASASNVAEILDDYETGTFTPTVSPTSGSFTAEGTHTGFYTKVGDIVNVYTGISITTNGSASAHISINGMPFTSAATGIIHTVNHGRETEINGNSFVTVMERSTTTISMLSPPFGNGAGYSVNAMYRTA